jgi:hypothetical protein
VTVTRRLVPWLLVLAGVLGVVLGMRLFTFLSGG